MIREKFRYISTDPDLVILTPEVALKLGPFTITPLPITHSIPETQALLIETAAGNLLHTADWKIDDNPVVGPPFERAQFKAPNLPPIDVVLCDSTNALSPGHSKSERLVQMGLERLIQRCEGRVIVSCFASNIARIQSIGRVAKRTERHLALTGRALERMTRIAKQCGYLGSDFPLISSHELAHFPPRHALFVATGSQGESGAMLAKLASERHPDFEIHPEDLFIFSSKTIPGNEEPTERLVQQITAKGATVYQAEQFPVLYLHASGHPNQTELADLYTTVRPKLVVPLHGEARHLAANADVAKAAGIHRTLTGGNGDLFSLVEPFRVRRNWGHAGRWAVIQDGKALEPVTA